MFKIVAAEMVPHVLSIVGLFRLPIFFGSAKSTNLPVATVRHVAVVSGEVP